MLDIISEFIRAMIGLAMLAFVWYSGKNPLVGEQKGWSLVMVGFSLVVMGMWVDISDNFPQLNSLFILGDTPYEAVLEKIIGGALGLAILAYGLYQWLPAVIRFGEKTASLQQISYDLEQKIIRDSLKLNEKEAYLDTVFHSVKHMAIIATRLDFEISYHNISMADFFPNEVDFVGKNAVELFTSFSEDHRLRLERARESVEQHQDFQYSIIHGVNKQQQHIDITVAGIWNERKSLIGFVISLQDVTTNRQESALMERQAYYDMLTELPNRRLFMEHLDQAFTSCMRYDYYGGLLFLDLDHFKAINDTLGHAAGDTLLQVVARRLKSGLREEDTAARLGGDEFVVLLPHLSTDQQKAASYVQIVAEKVQKLLAEEYHINEHHLNVTPSIGASLFPLQEFENESVENVLQRADVAMYKAKSEGRNNIQFYQDSMQIIVDNRLALEKDLRTAIMEDQLELYYQPQLNAEQELVGVEALLRWNHPKHGFISPAEFIGIAEDSGLIINIDQWVLLRAGDHLKSWIEKGLPEKFAHLAINISALQFRQANFIDQVENILETIGLDQHYLTLEITESVVIDNLQDTIEKMQALHALGIGFSIDDFGTGYSSLAYLKQLPLQQLKIDGSFVQNIANDPNSAAIVETITVMARHLNLEVIAEGVETVYQFEFLNQKGCQRYQGYYFSHPLSVEKLEQTFMQIQQN